MSRNPEYSDVENFDLLDEKTYSENMKLMELFTSQEQ